MNGEDSGSPVRASSEGHHRSQKTVALGPNIRMVEIHVDEVKDVPQALFGSYLLQFHDRSL